MELLGETIVRPSSMKTDGDKNIEVPQQRETKRHEHGIGAGNTFTRDYISLINNVLLFKKFKYYIQPLHTYDTHSRSSSEIQKSDTNVKTIKATRTRQEVGQY
jgi:hypothetical protein